MEISGTTRVFFVAGDPVAQVRAPALYNGLFRRHGVDAVLVPAHVAPADFPGFAAQVLRARNIDGLWLTIPHKTALVDTLDACDRHGRIAGSVNAVRRNADGTLEGALLDGTGFVKAVRHAGIDVRGCRALVVGIGGAGVAIAAALADAGVARLVLHDRAPARAAQVAALLAERLDAPAEASTEADAAGFDLVVHATPLGLRPDDPLPFDVARLRPDAFVVDILMKAAPTPLLRACTERGIAAQSGHEMLVQQTPETLRFFGFGAIADEVENDLSFVRRQVHA